MKTGELMSNGYRVQSQRTKAKLEENLDLVLDCMCRTLQLPADNPRIQIIQLQVYNALMWTADDVLSQAVKDGYVATR